MTNLCGRAGEDQISGGWMECGRTYQAAAGMDWGTGVRRELWARRSAGAYRKLAGIAVRVYEGLEDIIPGAAFDEVATERGEKGAGDKRRGGRTGGC